MKIIATPKVYLVVRPAVDWDTVQQFLEDEGLPSVSESIRAAGEDALAAVEVSARLCYMSFGRGRRNISDFILNLLQSKDGSVFEHVNYGFVFTGISRSLSHELVRHRAGFAYSQRSQRYVDEGEAAFVLPPAFKDNPEACQAFEIAVGQAHRAYALEADLLAEVMGDNAKGTDGRKAVRQAARSVLPNATETKMFVTANVRAWRHFIEMRASKYADAEIRRLALIVLAILEKEAPLLFGDFALDKLPDGSMAATPAYSKV